MASTYLAVTMKQGATIPAKIKPILGNYTPVQGSDSIFKTKDGMKLYFSSGYWYFDSSNEKQVAWVEGVASMVPKGGWKAPAESLFMRYTDLPLVVSLEKSEIMAALLPSSPTGAALSAKATQLFGSKACCSGCCSCSCCAGTSAKMTNCSQGLKKKLANDQIGTCCEGAKKHVGTLQKKLSNSHQEMKKTLSNRVADVKAASSSGSLGTKAKDFHKKVTDVHMPYVKQRTGELYERTRDVHAPYLKQKTGEAAVVVKDHAVRHGKNCYAWCTHPDTAVACGACKRMSCNILKFFLRACVAGVAMCLDKVADCCEGPTPTGEAIPQAALLNDQAEPKM